jgi:hypothetical protein
MAQIGNFGREPNGTCEAHPRRRLLWRLAVAVLLVLVALLFGHGTGGG